MSVIRRRECGRCGAEVREGKTRHFCGDPYPAKVTTDIREVEYVPASQVRGAVGDRDEMAALLTEAVRQDYGTPGWRARAIKAGCLTTTGGQ